MGIGPGPQNHAGALYFCRHRPAAMAGGDALETASGVRGLAWRSGAGVAAVAAARWLARSAVAG